MVCAATATRCASWPSDGGTGVSRPEPIWIRKDVLLAVHGRLLAEFGGSPGIRDEGLLESALARPQQFWAYSDPDLCDLAAGYAQGVVRNHPFVDGNKRAGFMAAFIFLMRNGQRPSPSESETVVMTRALAASEIDESEYAAWLRDNCRPRD